MNPLPRNRERHGFPARESAAAGLLVLAGALLRLRQYLTGRSLWADEAMLALNIVQRDAAGLLRPLEYDQGAPVGFLLIEKLFQTLVGTHELALRLFPLLVGLSSLGLFFLLLRRTTSGAGLLVALALFAFNPRLIYYSSEVKQYILDVGVTLSLLLVAGAAFRPSARARDYAWLALAGLLALWFSHPALFVLAGIGIGLLIVTLQRRDRSGLRFLTGMGLLWLLEAVLLYFLILRDLSQNTYMHEYWEGAFLPLPPWSDPGWFARALTENIGIQFGIPYAVFVVFFLMLVGWGMLWAGRRGEALAYAGIVLMTLTASALQLYPVFERMILFMVPLGLVLVGRAVEAVQARSRPYGAAGVLAVGLLAGYLLYGPVVSSARSFAAPRYFEHIRPALETLRDSWKEGDALYVSYGALPAFRFYTPFYELDDLAYEAGQREDYQNPQRILSRLRAYQGQPRLWVLFSHVYERGGFNERDFVLEFLNETGEKKREFRMPGTSVFLYLYDLRP